MAELRSGHRNAWQDYEPGLFGIGMVPEFAIGQRALLLRTEDGNFLWDCIGLLDPATIELICSLGGLRGIAISHPHYYSTMVEWSRAFGDAPIHLHAADQEWVMRSDPAVAFWDGEEKELSPGLKLVRCGGHFPGGTILHWGAGAEGRGALLTGDILQVTPGRTVSVMWSYPNSIPLPARDVQRVGATIDSLDFDRVYGAFWDRVIPKGAKSVVSDSLARYHKAVK